MHVSTFNEIEMSIIYFIYSCVHTRILYIYIYVLVNILFGKVTEIYIQY